MDENVSTVVLEPPTKEAVDYALRDLDYPERFVGYGMTASAGNHAKSLYSLRDAVLFLVGTPWDAPMLSSGFKGSLNWVNVEDFIAWLRDVIKDVALADAIESEALHLESYKLQSEKITDLINARMIQYREVYDAELSEAGNTAEDGADADSSASVDSDQGEED